MVHNSALIALYVQLRAYLSFKTLSLEAETIIFGC